MKCAICWQDLKQKWTSRRSRGVKMDAQETKRTKARNLRYKKAIVADVNLDKIREDLYDIMEACDEVRYFFESDDDTL